MVEMPAPRMPRRDRRRAEAASNPIAEPPKKRMSWLKRTSMAAAVVIGVTLTAAAGLGWFEIFKQEGPIAAVVHLEKAEKKEGLTINGQFDKAWGLYKIGTKESLQKAENISVELLNTAMQTRATFLLGDICARLGRLPEAESYYQIAEARYLREGNHKGVNVSTVGKAKVLRRMGELAKAKELIETTNEGLYRKSVEVAIARDMENWPRMLEVSESLLAQAVKAGVNTEMFRAHRHLAYAHIFMGDLERGAHHVKMADAVKFTRPDRTQAYNDVNKLALKIFACEETRSFESKLDQIATDSYDHDLNILISMTKERALRKLLF